MQGSRVKGLVSVSLIEAPVYKHLCVCLVCARVSECACVREREGGRERVTLLTVLIS